MKLPLAAWLSLLLASFPPIGGDADPGAPAPAPLQKVAIVGASVSAGVGLDPTADPFQGQESRVRLANVVEASIVGQHGLPVDLSSFMFFSAPQPEAKKSAREAKSAKATAVVAIDYLFWLGYGPGTEKQRLKRLEGGLDALEPISCPLLLGDLPDFNGAEVQAFVLPKTSIPARDELAKLNERIGEWAKERKNVVVVPVADLFQKLLAGETFEVRGNRFDAGARQRLMQRDGLHTTLEGTAALWVLAVDAWLAKEPEGLGEAHFVLDVAKLVERAPGLDLGAGKQKGGAGRARVGAK